jgi:hypothetical protein
MVLWPGHDIPPQGYATAAQCEATLDMLKRAGHDLFEKPGFHAWCEPAGPALVS